MSQHHYRSTEELDEIREKLNTLVSEMIGWDIGYQKTYEYVMKKALANMEDAISREAKEAQGE